MVLDPLTFRTVVESAALMAANHLLRADLRNLGIGHNRIWAKVDKVDSKFSMIKDHVTLWHTFGKYQVVIPTRKEWGKLAQSTEKRACLVYRWSL